MVKWAKDVEWDKNAEKLKLSQTQRNRIFDDIDNARHALYLLEKSKRKWWHIL
jgi:Spy/CpxP family protein refolding chaperone